MRTKLYKLLYITLVISIGCNIYCGFDYYQSVQNNKAIELFIENSKIKNVSIIDGANFILEKINTCDEKK